MHDNEDICDARFMGAVGHPGVRLKIDEPLARYTSMKIGGRADYFIEVEERRLLAQVLPLL